MRQALGPGALGSIFILEDMFILTSHFLSAQQPHVASGSRFRKVLSYSLNFSLSLSLIHTHGNLIFSTTYRSSSFPVRMGQQPLLRQLCVIKQDKGAESIKSLPHTQMFSFLSPHFKYTKIYVHFYTSNIYDSGHGIVVAKDVICI